ncbi:MAG: TrmH family RNA methyltransferase [Candidatus Doudnabacteria bacterium]|nr:TrmH family RNA methyltransferase [Candidatus Doudnabacteria bacterium]
MKSKKDFFVIAHNIRSLHNVGSIFRTADAFGISKIYLTGYTGRPDYYVHQNKIGKVALGAEKFVEWEYWPSVFRLIKYLRLKIKGIKIIALENNTKSVSIIKFKPKFPLALVLGEEKRGVSKKVLSMCDKAVEIPMQGKKESLNVSVAFGAAAFWISATKK